MEFTRQQASALKMLDEFIKSNNPDDKVFILKGYAGTGKTTIIKEMIATHREQIHVLLMAPTGKAAKVLRERTGVDNACTIHLGIYKREPIFIEQEGNDIETTEVKLTFPLNSKLAHDRANLCIIDEASMVSSRCSKSDDIIFGSGVLLDDLMKFVGLNSGSKIVFIGDPAQLPPIGDNTSNALNPEWFESKGYKPNCAELTEVVRQASDSAILSNSLKIRNLLDSEIRNELQFDKRDGEIEEHNIEHFTDLFVDNWVNGDKSAIITFSNAGAFSYNASIRERLGFSKTLLNKGECLMVVYNNMFDKCNPLFNGDNIEIESVDSEIETYTINVKKRIGEKVETEKVKLEFIDATIYTEEGVKVQRKLLVNLLNNNKPTLTPNEFRALYILLCIRHPGIKNHSEITTIIKNDPYYNALRVKYGYAVTCHKAQGSEWSTGYIDYTARTGLSDDALRWMYTATTRAKARLFAVGLPAITPLSKFDFSYDIKKLSKAPDNFYSKTFKVPETPFHKGDVMAPIKMKYWNVSERLAEKGLSVSNVSSYDWRESYTIDGFTYDAWYNQQGIFKHFNPAGDYSKDTLEILNSPEVICFNFAYETDNNLLKCLYQKMAGICANHGIFITNILNVSQYCTRYFLVTEDNEYAFIDFWHNSKGCLTRGIASSSLGNEDKKIKAVIEEFNDL